MIGYVCFVHYAKKKICEQTMLLWLFPMKFIDFDRNFRAKRLKSHHDFVQIQNIHAIFSVIQIYNNQKSILTKC